MKQRLSKLAAFLSAFTAACAASSQWSGFRGDGTSVTSARGLPLEWSDTNHIAWRVVLPGSGQSSPIIWGKQAYVTSVAGGRKETLIVQAFDLDRGAEVWRFSVESSNPEAVSDTRSQAAPTPVADADGVFAFFESGDCFALSHTGKLRWKRNISEATAKVESNHGLGGSPVLFERALLLPLDQAGPSSLLALDRTTGATLWKAAREGRTSWTTPVIARRHDAFVVILSGGGTVAGYDPEIGTIQFEVSGIVKNTVPSPTLAKDILIIGASSKGSNLALDMKSGATEKPTILWRSDTATCGFASPLVHRGRAYFVSSSGVLSCLRAASGEVLFEERLGESVWASPIGAEDQVYLFGEKGRTTVLAAQDRFSMLHVNQLKHESTVTGVAAVDWGFFVRAGSELIRIGNCPTISK